MDISIAGILGKSSSERASYCSQSYILVFTSIAFVLCAHVHTILNS
jgi:hypothetical protein